MSKFKTWTEFEKELNFTKEDDAEIELERQIIEATIEARKKAQLTQQELSELTGIVQSSIAKIETLLKTNGYLEIEKNQNKKEQFEYDYLIYEKPHIRFVDMEKPYMENDTQINTNKQNTKNKDKYDKPLNPLLIELINKKFLNENDLQLSYYDDLLNEMLEEYNYHDLIKVCGYIASAWKFNKGYDENGNYIKNKFSYFKTSLINNLNKLNTTVDLGY